MAAWTVSVAPAAEPNGELIVEPNAELVVELVIDLVVELVVELVARLMGSSDYQGACRCLSVPVGAYWRLRCLSAAPVGACRCLSAAPVGAYRCLSVPVRACPCPWLSSLCPCEVLAKCSLCSQKW